MPSTPHELAELVELRAELVRIRARGIRSLEYEGRRLTYATDAELVAAIADLDRRIDGATPGRRPGVVRFSTSKGF